MRWNIIPANPDVVIANVTATPDSLILNPFRFPMVVKVRITMTRIVSSSVIVDRLILSSLLKKPLIYEEKSEFQYARL